jgi:hypothetical protein
LPEGLDRAGGLYCPAARRAVPQHILPMQVPLLLLLLLLLLL